MDNPQAVMVKQALRERMRRRLAAMPAEIAAAKSAAACAALVRLPEFVRARAVMIYCAMPEEVETAGIARAAWRAGKTVAAPRVGPGRESMAVVAFRSFDDGLRVGAFGIREPIGEPMPVDHVDLVVVPALAFDRRGSRLGRGGGYYDRFLADGSLGAFACGLAFAEQVVDAVPIDRHDRAVAALVTDEEVLRFAP